jgi:hypothetical protein
MGLAVSSEATALGLAGSYHRRMRRFLGPLLLLALTPTAPAVSLPAGEPSVTVVSLSGNQSTTTDIAVQLVLVWPSGAEQATVDNGPGTASQTLLVADVVSWQLVPLGELEPGATRTVTVTFTGPSIAASSASDSIVLDTRPPRIPRQRLFPNGNGWFLAVRADDPGTGVRSVAVLGRTGQPLQTSGTCAADPCVTSTLQTYFARNARPRTVRVTDGAGNAKAKTLVRRATTCSAPDGRYPVFKATDRFYDCAEAGDRCNPDDGHFWNRSAYVRCRKVDGRYRVVVR